MSMAKQFPEVLGIPKDQAGYVSFRAVLRGVDADGGDALDGEVVGQGDDVQAVTTLKFISPDI